MLNYKNQIIMSELKNRINLYISLMYKMVIQMVMQGNLPRVDETMGNGIGNGRINLKQ